MMSASERQESKSSGVIGGSDAWCRVGEAEGDDEREDESCNPFTRKEADGPVAEFGVLEDLRTFGDAGVVRMEGSTSEGRGLAAGAT